MTNKKKTVIIILSIIFGIVILIGICGYAFISYIESSVEDMQVVVEDLETGSKQQVTEKGFYTSPRYSKDGKNIYYINRDKKNIIIKSNLENSKLIKTYSIKEGHKPTTSVSNNNILCYSDNNLYIYSLKNKETRQLTNDQYKKEEAIFSPNGKWIAYLEKKDSTANIYVVPSKGGKKIKLTNIEGMLSKIQTFTWLNNSRQIAYISFRELIITDIKGEVVKKFDLTGLSNFKSLLAYPNKPDYLLLCAREADGGFSFTIFAINIKNGQLNIVTENRPFFEMFYDISPDGKKLVYMGTL